MPIRWAPSVGRLAVLLISLQVSAVHAGSGGCVHTDNLANGTMCTQFCEKLPSLDTTQHAGKHSRVRHVAEGQVSPLFLSATPQDIEAVAEVNPEAAMALALLVARSAQPDIVPPTNGDGVNQGLVSRETVQQFLREGLSATTPWVGMTTMSNARVRSRFAWILTESSARTAELLIHHQIADENDNALDVPYQDVVVQLARATSLKGGQYWQATGWAVKERP